MTRFVLAVVLGVVLALGGIASADTPATRYFQAGQQAYNLGDFATAVEAFHEAHALDPAAETAFSYAQALRRLYYVDLDSVLLERARVLYRAYLDGKPEGPRARHARQHVTTIDRLLLRLTAKPADAPLPTQLLLTSEVGVASARIDDGPPVPIPAAVDVVAGSHRVTLAAPGYDPVSIDVIALAGKVVVATANPVPRPGRLRVVAGDATIALDGVRLDGTAATVTPGRHTLVVRRAGYVPQQRDVIVPLDGEVVVDVELERTPRRRLARALFVGGGLLVGGSVLTGLFAYSAQRDAIAAAELPRDLAAYEDARGRRDTWRTTAVALGIGAVLAAGIGFYLHATDDAQLEAPPPEMLFQPVVGPDTIGVAWSFE